MPMNSGKDYVAREVEVARPLMAAGPVGGNQGGDFIVQSVALRGREGGATAELGGEQAYALRAAAGGGSDPYVLAPIPILEAGARTGASTTDIRAGMGVGKPGDPMFTLQSGKQHAIAFSCKDHGADATEELAPTMRAMNHSASHANAGGQLAVCVTGNITHTLKAEGFDGSEDGSGRGQPIIAFHTQQDPISSSSSSSLPLGGKDRGNGLLVNMAVRRLMPVECERLQGFPDGWTLVPVGKKVAADGPRYKQLGNSWAVNHARWVGSRVAEELACLDSLETARTSTSDEITPLLWLLAA